MTVYFLSVNNNLSSTATAGLHLHHKEAKRAPLSFPVATLLFIFPDNKCLFTSYSLELLVPPLFLPVLFLRQQGYDQIKTGSSKKRLMFMPNWATMRTARHNEI